MTIRNLENAVHPSAVAIIGASPRVGSVGRVVLNNIVAGGFAGEVFPVNPKYQDIDGRRCFPGVADIPGVPDLAIIVTPPPTVPNLVRELGEKGTRAAVVITAGLTEENGLRQMMLDAARPFLLRIIGPNTIGLLVPAAKLNASFAHMGAPAGKIALLSQSGAIAVSLIDWAADNQVGFSQVVSLGDMADVDAADYLDLLAGDANTHAIVMYLEAIPHPRKFMSAARAAARLKPVVAIKPGRHAAAAMAAATHTGALSGADRVVDAALHRAGILRVQGLAELFDATETISLFPPLERARLGIVTNGGGAGVLAADELMDHDGELAVLSVETMARLKESLPHGWSHANPVDIVGDAPAERYLEAVEALALDTGTDALLVMNCPTGLVSSVEAATAVASRVKSGVVNGKPVLTCWLGDRTAREGRHILQAAGAGSYETPAQAIAGLSYLQSWSRAQRALMQVPASQGAIGDRDLVLAIFRKVAAEGRFMLTEPEAKTAIAAYGIPVPETLVAGSPSQVESAATLILKSSRQVVVKLLSRALTHKSDVGGVVLGIESAQAAREAAMAVQARAKSVSPGVEIEGFAVQPMVVRRYAQELILGASRDPVFGPVILFGAGGVAVEVIDDSAVALPPLDEALAGDLIDRTRVARLLDGYRDRKPADRAAISLALNGLSQMIVDFPCIISMDVNPLLADADGVIALDARIKIEPAAVERTGPNPDLAIRPYPSGWESDISTDDEMFHIRPIRPSDIALYPDFIAKVSAEDLRLRFLAPRKSFSDQMLKRLTQLDYDREMAFVALERVSGALAGIVRLSADPDHEAAEFGLLVRSDLQGHGIGFALLRRLIEYATADGLKRVEGVILGENAKMLLMCQELGFAIAHHPSEIDLRTAVLDIGSEPRR